MERVLSFDLPRANSSRAEDSHDETGRERGKIRHDECDFLRDSLLDKMGVGLDPERE